MLVLNQSQPSIFGLPSLSQSRWAHLQFVRPVVEFRPRDPQDLSLSQTLRPKPLAVCRDSKEQWTHPASGHTLHFFPLVALPFFEWWPKKSTLFGWSLASGLASRHNHHFLFADFGGFLRRPRADLESDKRETKIKAKQNTTPNKGPTISKH